MINNLSEFNVDGLQNEDIETFDNALCYDYLSKRPLQITDGSCVICYTEQLKNLSGNSIPINEIKIMFLDYVIEDTDILLLERYLSSDAGEKITSLCCMESQLTNSQANKLIEILIKSSCAIEKLSLCDNDLNNDLSFLCNIKYFNNSLKFLDLSANDLSQSIEAVIEIINNCPLLEKLYLGICHLSDADVKKLCIAVKSHPNLMQICLNDNKNITEISASYFKELIQQNNRLQYIDLSGIKFSNASITKLNILAEENRIQVIVDQPPQFLQKYLTACVIS